MWASLASSDIVWREYVSILTLDNILLGSKTQETGVVHFTRGGRSRSPGRTPDAPYAQSIAGRAGVVGQMAFCSVRKRCGGRDRCGAFYRLAREGFSELDAPEAPEALLASFCFNRIFTSCPLCVFLECCTLCSNVLDDTFSFDFL